MALPSQKLRCLFRDRERAELTNVTFRGSHKVAAAARQHVAEFPWYSDFDAIMVDLSFHKVLRRTGWNLIIEVPRFSKSGVTERAQSAVGAGVYPTAWYQPVRTLSRSSWLPAQAGPMYALCSDVGFSSAL
jgi:hypothetical protein